MHSYFHLCIMVHSMEKVIFYLEEQWYKSCLAEAAQAVRSCGQYGFKADLMVIEAGEEIPEPEYSALYLRIPTAPIRERTLNRPTMF